MKKFLMSAIAATLVATPMVATSADAQVNRKTTVQHRQNGNVVKRTVVRRTPNRVANRNYRRVANRNYRRWAKGQRFDRRYANNYRVVDWRQYRGRRLYAPPRGYHWVRSGNDAVLVGITSGLIGAVIAGAIIN